MPSASLYGIPLDLSRLCTTNAASAKPKATRERKKEDPPDGFEPGFTFYTHKRDTERGRYLGGYWLAGPACRGCCWPPACSAGRGKRWAPCCWGSWQTEQDSWKRFLLLNSAYKASRRERLRLTINSTGQRRDSFEGELSLAYRNPARLLEA